MRWMLLVVTVVGLGALGVWFKGCLDVDRCLDSGGRYNYQDERCEYE